MMKLGLKPELDSGKISLDQALEMIKQPEAIDEEGEEEDSTNDDPEPEPVPPPETTPTKPRGSDDVCGSAKKPVGPVVCEIKCFPIKNTKLCISKGSVVNFGKGRRDWIPEKTAIVNAANTGGLGGGGVDEAVTTAGGTQLDIDRRDFKIEKTIKYRNGRKKDIRIETGQAKTTGPKQYGTLFAKIIIHAVGPDYRDYRTLNFQDMENADKKLREAYYNAIDQSVQKHCEYLGFSLLSSGIFRGNKTLEEVLKIGLQNVCETLYTKPNTLKEVHLVGFTEVEQDTLLLLAKDIVPKFTEINDDASLRPNDGEIQCYRFDEHDFIKGTSYSTTECTRSARDTNMAESKYNVYFSKNTPKFVGEFVRSESLYYDTLYFFKNPKTGVETSVDVSEEGKTCFIPVAKEKEKHDLADSTDDVEANAVVRGVIAPKRETPATSSAPLNPGLDWGIGNLGATCYANASMQFLSRNPELREAYLDKQGEKNQVVHNEAMKISKYLNGDNSILKDDKSLLSSIKTMQQKVFPNKWNKQQDASENIIKLIQMRGLEMDENIATRPYYKTKVTAMREQKDDVQTFESLEQPKLKQLLKEYFPRIPIEFLNGSDKRKWIEQVSITPIPVDGNDGKKYIKFTWTIVKKASLVDPLIIHLDDETLQDNFSFENKVNLFCTQEPKRNLGGFEDLLSDDPEFKLDFDLIQKSDYDKKLQGLDDEKQNLKALQGESVYFNAWKEFSELLETEKQNKKCEKTDEEFKKKIERFQKMKSFQTILSFQKSKDFATKLSKDFATKLLCSIEANGDFHKALELFMKLVRDVKRSKIDKNIEIVKAKANKAQIKGIRKTTEEEVLKPWDFHIEDVSTCTFL
eukprot:GSMAST32.ASY1.ANO1.1806.1 assembled CDS